ncbi:MULTISPECIES: YbaY family lipoprotein [unclassified Streptomyces]|uniref:YbaY family lipoprotein n=1 Tax=unclassified Streptomyces TaxID=2593676 RepID=UPI002259ADE1|nr:MULTISPECIES: YbaY family lipoprotein [unclassified Streptomyces]MCX5327905.1 YbaY family lipoprotein [Streptomyces sp. NBC_00140]MCX5357393.1 YbaY family lipoprotein [Streptomyces sp. NBC_00124]
MTNTVTGFVSLPSDTPAETAASLLVEVRDVSLADAPSTVVGAQVQTDVPLSPGGRVPFRVNVPELDSSATYGLRVHVDRSGSGTLESGDLINTQAIQVRTESIEGLEAPVNLV